MALSTEDRIDGWLRGEGLPYLVPRERRAHDLLQRTSPAIVVALGGVLLDVLAGPLLATGFNQIGDPLGNASGLLVLAILLLSVVAPLAAARWLWRAMIVWSDAVGRLVAGLLISAYAVASGILGGAADNAALAGAANALGVTLALHVLVWLGAGSILMWAARWAWRSLGAVQSMTSRALPVILVLVVFAYFSTEPWQISDSLPFARQLALSAVITTIAVLAILPVARGELISAHRDLSAEQAADLLRGTPLHGAPTGPVSGRALTRGARVNVLAVLVLAHLIQAAMFLMVIVTLLVTLGRLAITDAIVQTWLQHPRVPYTFLGDPLPLDHQTVRAAFLLGIIGALSFILTSLSDPSYRALFFDPLVERVKVAVAAHRAVTQSVSSGDGVGPAAATPAGQDDDKGPVDGIPEVDSPPSSERD